MKPLSAPISDSRIQVEAGLRAQEIGALVLRYGLALGEARTCGARIPA